MAFFDMPLPELERYMPMREEMPDFDAFWTATLAHARTFDLEATFEEVDQGSRIFTTYDVTYNGFAGQPIKGWFILPARAEGLLPCIVQFVGYGGGRGFSFDHFQYPAAGYATLVMDTRGQGSTWSPGDTPDIQTESGNPFFPGFMTQGILDKTTYYYRRVFTDAVRAVEAAASHPQVDSGKVVITGGSQGGGITLAVAGLMAGKVIAAMPDVPFLCHYRRATTLIDSAPYSEIRNYLKTHRDHIEKAFTTLSYFDGVNFATRATSKSLFSVGLMDDICPPSTVYAAYNHYRGEKSIRIYQFNNHEGGQSFHHLEKLRFLESLW